MKASSFITHAAAAVVITGLCLLVYATVQQNHRSNANYPQLQLARDIANRVASNQQYEHLLPTDRIELSQSLGLFVTLYNNNGMPVQSTGMLDGKLPQIPKGVLDFARSNKEDVLTWQPREGVRQAVVIESTGNADKGFVMAGRSLEEVERHESNLVQMVFIAWVCCMGIVALHWAVQVMISKRVKAV